MSYPHFDAGKASALRRQLEEESHSSVFFFFFTLEVGGWKEEPSLYGGINAVHTKMWF